MDAGGFHHRVAHWLMVKHPWRSSGGFFEYPLPEGGDEGGRIVGGGYIPNS